MEEIWNILNKVSVIVGIFSFIPFLISASLLLTRSRRYKKQLKAMEESTGDFPVAVSIGLSGTELEGQVRQFIKKNFSDMPLRTYAREAGVTKEVIPSVIQGLKDLKNELSREGVTEVHLFYSGPVALAIALGDLFNNWVPVKIYHLNRDKGAYEFWTVLYKGLMPEAERPFLKELVES